MEKGLWFYEANAAEPSHLHRPSAALAGLYFSLGRELLQSATDKQKHYVAQSYCCCTKATSTLVDSYVKINTLLWHTFIKNNMFIDLN
jgi:hypothetical protein